MDNSQWVEGEWVEGKDVKEIVYQLWLVLFLVLRLPSPLVASRSISSQSSSHNAIRDYFGLTYLPPSPSPSQSASLSNL